MENIHIVNSQNVNVEMVKASVGERLLAAIVDYGILLCYFLIIIVAARNNEVLLSILYIPSLFYSLLMEVFWNGQSPGKRIMNIRVTKQDGSAPAFFDYVLRWVFRLIDINATVGSLAVILIAVTAKGQRVGDMAASTIVIKNRKAVSIQSIRYMNLEEHQVVYPQAAVLSDEDIDLIQKVLNFYSNSDFSEKSRDYIAETTRYIHTKMGVEWPRSTIKFLHTVLKDCNALKSQV